MKQELHLPGEGAQMLACWDLPSGRCTQPASGRRAATKPALRLAYYPGSLGGFLSACFLRTASKICPSWWACGQSKRVSPWLWPQAARHEWLGWAGGLFLQQESRSVSRAEGKNTGARKNAASVGEGATRARPCPPHLWPCHLRPHCPASPLLPQAPERGAGWGGTDQVSQFSEHCRNKALPLHLLPSRRAAAAHPPPQRRAWPATSNPGERNGQRATRPCAQERVFLVYLAPGVLSTAVLQRPCLLHIPRQWVSLGPPNLQSHVMEGEETSPRGGLGRTCHRSASGCSKTNLFPTATL